MAEYKSSYTGAQIDAGIGKANTALQPINYSTIEQNTGLKWIDGKDIYQATIECTFSHQGTEDVQPLNIDTLIKNEAFIKLTSTNETFNLNYDDHGNFACWLYRKARNDIYFQSTSVFNNSPCVMTLFYTKVITPSE